VLERFHSVARGVQKEPRCSSPAVVKIRRLGEHNDRGIIVASFVLFWVTLYERGRKCVQ